MIRRGVWAISAMTLAAAALAAIPGEQQATAELPATTVESGSDIPAGAWHRASSLWAIEQDAIRPFGDGTFRPTEPLSRARTAAALWRLAGRPHDVGPGRPVDVPAGRANHLAIAWAVERGLMTTDARNRFRPTQPVRRAALARAVWRWAGAPRTAPDRAIPGVPSGTPRHAALVWALHHGALRPTTTGAVRPTGTSTRAQVAVALHRTQQRRDEGPPNLVVILTDDQTLESMRVMPQVRRLVADEGTTFANAFATFPLCCPSRATLLTGQYSHNHQVRNNIRPHGGHGRLEHTNTLATWLRDGGYATAHVGKYLNCYGSTHSACATGGPDVPAGWERWFGMPDPYPANYGYFSFDVYDDGRLRRFGPAPDVYQTDVLADRAVADIRRFAERRQPFFVNVWPLAPHSGRGPTAPNTVSPAPSPAYAGTMAGEVLPNDASYGEADISDKPAYVRGYWAGHFANQNRPAVTRTYRAVLESLQSVDDLVAAVVDALEETGELDRTVVVFTSDNGWMFGEHRITFDKVVPYEESVRVPLVIRGPGFPAGATAEQIVGNQDLAPTLADLAGVRPGRTVDGRSLLPLAADPGVAARRAVLLQSWPAGTSNRVPHYTGIRVPGQVYLEYAGGDRELYDLTRDPHQLDNLADHPAWAARRAVLAEALGRLRTCAGASCAVTVPPGGP